MNLGDLLRSIDGLKGVLGIAFGFMLAFLTPWLWRVMNHPYSDITLLGIYLSNYFIASLTSNKVLHLKAFWSGVATFFSLEFIAWVALFEAILKFGF